jgi:hypothetical protein
MKADAAWHALEGKVAGTDAEYKDVKVTALIAVQPATVCPEGAHPTCMLPAEVRRGGARGLDRVIAFTKRPVACRAKVATRQTHSVLFAAPNPAF